MATLYAKSGGGNWSAAGTWSNVNAAGVDNSGPPTAGDNVIFELASGNVTIDAAAACRSLDTTSGTGSYGGVLTHTAAFTLSIGDGTAGPGSVALKLNSGMTYTLGSASTSAVTFASTNATIQTVTTGGKSLGDTTFNGVAGSWQLADANTVGPTASVTLTTGTLDTNGQTCTWGRFSGSGSLARVLTLGASNITLNTASSNVTMWNLATTTLLTFNANSSSIICSTTGSGCSFNGGGLTFSNLTIIDSPSFNISSANTFSNVTITASASSSLSVGTSLGADQIITDIFTVTGQYNPSIRIIINSNTIGTTRKITAASTSITDVDFQDISGAGVGAWVGTRVGDCGGNSGITFAPTRTVYWVGTAGGNWNATVNWSLSSGGQIVGAAVPCPQDTVNFDVHSISSGGKTITVNALRLCKDLNFTGLLFVPTFSRNGSSNTNYDLFGSLTLISNMIFGPTQASSTFRLMGRGVHAITSAGLNINSAGTTTFAGVGGTYTLNDSLRCSNTLALSGGTLDANGSNVTCPSMSISGSLVRTLKMGSGTWTLNGTGTVWITTTLTNLTLVRQTSTILISEVDGAGKTFQGGGLTYNNLSITGGGTGDIIFSGNNTFNTLTISNPKTIKFTAGSNQTMNYFYATGASGALIFLRSTIDNYPWYLSVLKGYATDYVDVRRSVSQ